MNFLKNIFRGFSIILVSFAVLWIITGSTIEFHQKYVYHKFVDLWQTQIAQSGKDFKKSIRFVEKSNLNIGGNDSFVSENYNFCNDANLNLSEKNIFSRYLFDLITSEYHLNNVLRGPPAA
jgi:hypothetical protein